MPAQSEAVPVPSSIQSLTIAQVAKALQVEALTVRRWISAGDLRAYRYGPRTIRIDPADVKRMRRPVTVAAAHREAVEAAREEESAARLGEAVMRRIGGVR